MSKITNDGLTRSGTGCFIAISCTHMATVGVKGLIHVHSAQYTIHQHYDYMVLHGHLIHRRGPSSGWRSL